MNGMRHRRQSARVVRRSVPALLLVLVVSGCSGPGTSSTPTNNAGVSVTGTLQTVGGPPPGRPRSAPGTVVFHGGKRTPITAIVDKDGKFTATVPPGSYTVIGLSPGYYTGPCDGVPVTITTTAPAPSVHVYCQEA